MKKSTVQLICVGFGPSALFESYQQFTKGKPELGWLFLVFALGFACLWFILNKQKKS